MTDKATAVVRIKARFLKERMDIMTTMLAEEVVDKCNLALRMADLTSSFHKYEELYENLIVVDKSATDITEWSELRELYYQLATKINALNSATATLTDQTLPSVPPAASSTFVEKQKLLRLPIAELPKFDGQHSQWLSYKNAFLSMVDARSDIDDTVKFLYLRDSLAGDAARKIAVYDIRDENYARAWRTLMFNYERRRILVSKHVDAILGILPVKDATAKELSNLVDEVNQHLSMLESLKVKVDCRIVIRLVERALPAKVREKWEEAIGLDELPGLDRLFAFINETTFRLSTLEADAVADKTTPIDHLPIEPSRPSKFKRKNDGARALVTNVNSPCTQCKGPHALYKCEIFKSLSVPERWNMARTNKLCFNCLRSHKGKCGMSHCRACDKYHNTLLHSEPRLEPRESSQPLTNSATAPAQDSSTA